MWYVGYGWRRNPFNVKSSSEILGLDKEKQLVLDYVNGHDICLITGKPGVGKTSMLKWLMKQLGIFTKAIYFNAEDLNENFNLKKKVGKPWLRKRVLLIDESHNCDEQFIKELKNLWDSNKIHSVVITQIGDKLDSYPEGIKSRIGSRIMRFYGMNSELAKELIKMRTGNNHPFNDEVLDLIVDDAKNNPRKILENCEHICIKLQDKKKILPEDVKAVLTRKKADRLMELAKLEEPTSLPDNLMPISSKKLKPFSPMQKRLILLLFDGNRTAKQISQILNSSEGSVGKQLSVLTEHGAVHIVNQRRPKVYGLSKDFKLNLH